MQFTFKDFEQFYMSELSEQFILDPQKTIRKAFIFDGYVLIMRKARKYYQVIQSSKCGFEPMFRFSTFDLLYQSEDEIEVVKMYLSYLQRLIGVITKNGLHKSN